MSKRLDTFGQRVIFINKTKKYAVENGYKVASTPKAVRCSRCPHCGKPSLIHFVKRDEDYKDESVGILGICFNRFYASEDTVNCHGKSWIRRASPSGEKHEEVQS